MYKFLKDRNVGKALCVFVLAVVVIMPVCAFAETSSCNSVNKTITVYGKAEISVRPDVAYFPMDISTTAPIIDDAYSENMTKVENTIKKLEKLGIRREWIKVLDGQLFRAESYGAGEAAIFGVSNIVVLTIPNIDKMKPEKLKEKVFSIAQAVSRTTVTPYAASSSPGAGRINGELSKTISYYGYNPVAVFGITNYEKMDEKLLVDAIKDAKKEAEGIAKILDVKLKEMTYFYQSYPYDNSCSNTGNQSEILPEGPKSSNAKAVKLCATVNLIYSFE